MAACAPPSRAAWESGADSARGLAGLDAGIEAERFRGACGDLWPVAAGLVGASRAEGDPAAAVGLAKLAVKAAPGDPRTRANMLWAAAAHKRSPGLVAHELVQTVRAAVCDPWFQAAGILKLATVLWAGAVLASFALLSVLLPRVGPCLYHDFTDAFPTHLRRFVPPAFVVLATAAFWTAGVGPGVMLLGLGLALLPYLPGGTRWILGCCLALSCAGTVALERFSTVAGEPGQRAWAYYRVFKGDSGPELEVQLAKGFGAGDVDALLARSALARRARRYGQAASLLEEAMSVGADEGRAQLERGNISYLDDRYPEAAVAYERAAALRPKDPIPWLNLHVAYLEQLLLPEADRALETAGSLGAGVVHRFQSDYRGGDGPLLPLSVPLDGARVRTELLVGGEAAPAWVSGIEQGLFVALGPLRPAYLGGVALLVTWLAGLGATRRHSYRCPSCGLVVCPRCSRRIRGSETCSACWSLSSQKGVDSAESERHREAASLWKRRSNALQAIAAAAAPGWADVARQSNVRGLALGVVWSVSGGSLLLGALYPVSAMPWGAQPGWWPAWAALGLCHLAGARRFAAGSRTGR